MAWIFTGLHMTMEYECTARICIRQPKSIYFVAHSIITNIIHCMMKKQFVLARRCNIIEPELDSVCVCVPCQDQNKLPISVSVYCPLTFNFKTKISHLTRVVCRYRCNAGASKLTCCMDRVCVWEKREIERWRLFDCGPRAKSTFLVSCRDIDFSFSGIPLNAMGTSFVATCVPCRMWSSIV